MVLVRRAVCPMKLLVSSKRHDPQYQSDLQHVLPSVLGCPLFHWVLDVAPCNKIVSRQTTARMLAFGAAAGFGKLVLENTCLFFYVMPARRWWKLINSLVDSSICKYKVWQWWRVIVVCIVLHKYIACDVICDDLVQIQYQPCAWAGLKFNRTLTLTKLQSMISW